MLSPKRTKFRRYHRGRVTGLASRGNKLYFGEFALQALEAGWLTARQIEAGRRVMSRYARRGGKLWVRIFPDRPITRRPADTRMGSGKGSPEFWVAIIKPGRILYELRGISPPSARKILRIAATKMPFPTQIIEKSAPSATL